MTARRTLPPPKAAGTFTRVRLTEFWGRMDAALGETYARSWAHDVVLTELDGLTVEQALLTDRPVREVWRQVATALDLPERER